MNTSIPILRSWQSVRREAFDALRDVLSCAYCEKQGTDTTGPDGRPWSIDHVVPQSKGGTDDLANLVKSCHRCNSHKHNKQGPEWTPADDVMTAARIPFGEVDLDRLQKHLDWNSRSAQMTHYELLLLAQDHIRNLEEQIRVLQKQNDVLERYVWDAGKAFADVVMIANGARPRFDIGYNPSTESVAK